MDRSQTHYIPVYLVTWGKITGMILTQYGTIFNKLIKSSIFFFSHDTLFFNLKHWHITVDLTINIQYKILDKQNISLDIYSIKK